MKSYKTYILYIKILITAIILWMLARHAQLNLELTSKFFVYPLSVLTIMGLCCVMVIMHAWRWYRLNTVQNIQLSFFNTIMPTYVGIAFNNILPGSVGGDFFRLYSIIKKFPKQK